MHGHPAKDVEEVCGHDRAIEPFRLAGPRQREAGGVVARDGTERSTPRTHVHEKGVGIVDDRKSHLRSRSPKADDAVGVVKRQRPQDGRVDDAEDGDVGADTNRQRQQGDRRERETSAQGPHAIAYVVPDSNEPGVGGRLPQYRITLDRRRLDRSKCLPEYVRGGQLGERGTPGLPVGHSGFHELAVTIVEVLSQLLDDVVDAGRIGGQARQSGPQFRLPVRR